MRRGWAALALAFLLLTGCARGAAEELDVLSAADFEARTAALLRQAREGDGVRLSGFYAADDARQYIFRTGVDGVPVGFELVWTGEPPLPGDEIRVEGRFHIYEEDGARYLTILAERLTNRSALERAETCDVPEEGYLEALRPLYEHPEDYEGALVTISGRLRLRGDRCSVERQAVYISGDSAPVGLFFEWPGELPEPGAWVTVTGFLREQEGEPVLEAQRLVCGAGGAELVYE